MTKDQDDYVQIQRLTSSDDEQEIYYNSECSGGSAEIAQPRWASRTKSLAPRRFRSTRHSDSDATVVRRTNVGLFQHVSEANIEFAAHIYQAVVQGQREALISALESKPVGVNTRHILHIAAISGQASLITDILPQFNEFLMEDCNGDLPFHCAAKAGHLNALKALTNWQVCWPDYPPEDLKKLLGKPNKKGDTPLHIAVATHQVEMSMYLVHHYSYACYLSNKAGDCPLYLAIKAREWELLNCMILRLKEEGVPNVDSEGNSVVHALIDANNLEMLEGLLKTHGRLIQSTDEEGRRPLSYAAYTGFVEGVEFLLREFRNYAYIPDNDEDGSFPIHQAAAGGHIQVIRKLVGTQHLLNNKGQNILHVAARRGQSEVVSSLLKISEFERLINWKDDNGNTPLHLAAMGFHPRVVYVLTSDPRVKVDLVNKYGVTALDLVEIDSTSNPTFEERLTWMALKYVNAPRSSRSTRKSYFKRKKRKNSKLSKNKAMANCNNDTSSESVHAFIDTPLVIATLVSTVAFAAGFTLPGGYNQSENDVNIGMGILARERAFQVFVVCNMIAMYSSVVAIVALVSAKLGENKLKVLYTRFALLVLGFALVLMSLAFLMGLFVALRNSAWLSCVVLGTGFFFLSIIILFCFSIYSPSHHTNPIHKFLSRCIFLLFLLVCKENRPKHS